MKKMFSILIIGILMLSSIHVLAANQEQSDQMISEKINISSPTISAHKEYIKISLEESDSVLMRNDKPMMPSINKVFTFPFGTKIEDVTILFDSQIDQILDKKIMPTPKTEFISTEFSTIKEIEKVDYSSISVYPEKRFSYDIGSGLYQGERSLILSIQIYPVTYTPSQNSISYVKEATIDITYTPPTETFTFDDEYDYLVLAPAEFADELQPLIDYKNNDGLATILKTLDEIPDIGDDEPESIKYFIKDAIEQWGIEYVLLVGGWVQRSNEQPVSEFAKFPIRKAYIPSGNYESWFPSDLYYADIYDGNGSFSTWDANGNGRYAEITSLGNDIPAMDLYPDVSLGRIPCISEKEVTDMVNKIILFEEHNKMTNKIVQIGGDTFPGDPENVNEGEFANVEVMKNLPDYDSIRLWASESNGARKLSKANIANGFNSNVDFVDFSGHGSYASWATHAPSDDETWLPPKSIISPYTGWLYIDYDLFMVNNKEKHPIVIFNACSCSKFSESRQCMSWTSVRGETGGIASYGASGIGYGSYGTSETDRVWGWMEVNIIKGIYEDKILGDVWNDCISEYTSNFITEDADLSDYKTVVEVSLFGDPTLSIEDGKEPKSHDSTTYSLIDLIDHIFAHVSLKELIQNLLTMID